MTQSAAQTFTITIEAGSSTTAPVANDDFAATDENTPATISVLANDTDPDGDSLTIVSIVPPLNGSVIPNLSATNITYTPSTDFAGVDTFQYQISDGHGGSSLLATVTVTVNATGPAATATMTTSGRLQLAAGTTLDLSNVTLQAGSTFGGSGTLDLPGPERRPSPQI